MHYNFFDYFSLVFVKLIAQITKTVTDEKSVDCVSECNAKVVALAPMT